MKDTFQRIHDTNAWGGSESVSGPGSSLVATLPIRMGLPPLLRKYNISRILDIPCGDFHWMWEVLGHMPTLGYIGADIVLFLVEGNKEMWPEYDFMELDITTSPLPMADLVLVRDCLVHMSLADATRALWNIKKSGIGYLLMTNFSEVVVNEDRATGRWRPLNFTRKPFNMPQPLEAIHEGNAGYPDKELALWKL